MKNKRVPTPTGDMILFVHENRHRRPLREYVQLPDEVGPTEFYYFADQVTLDDDGNAAELYVPRFFEYRGAWFDSHEFEVAPDWIKALGYDVWQTDSAFSAVVVCWFDRDGDPLDDEVIVGYIHW